MCRTPDSGIRRVGCVTEFSPSAGSLHKRGTGDQIRIITALRARRGYIHMLLTEILQSYIAPVRWSKSIVEVGDRKRTAVFSKSSLRRSSHKWNKSPAQRKGGTLRARARWYNNRTRSGSCTCVLPRVLLYARSRCVWIFVHETELFDN